MDSTNVSLKKVLIKDLNLEQINIMVVGIIIGKQKPKVIMLKNGQERTVWNFTIRDSPAYYINVSYWGSVEQIFQANDKFKTGDVVEIYNPQILFRRTEDKSEQYVPMVTSPFKLSLTEKSAIVAHPEHEDYLRLLRFPTKPTAAFYALQGIHNSGRELSAKGFYVDILCAVRGLGPIKTITSRINNENLQFREIEVFDHTCPSLKVTLWEPELINRSNSWKPRFTILFMTDLCIAWSNYGNTFIAKVTSRSIVTEDPVTKEATVLLEYAKNAPIETFDIVEQLATSLPSASSAEEVLNVRQLHSRLNDCLDNKQHGNKPFTVVLYAYLTHFDLDGLSQTLLIKCGRCKMATKGMRCENPQCPVVFEREEEEPEITFDMKIMITDHTGTLTNCRLSGQAATNALNNCSAKDFVAMSDDQKYALKWQYLLQRCKIRIGVIFVTSQYPVILVLSIEKADPLEVASKLSF